MGVQARLTGSGVGASMAVLAAALAAGAAAVESGCICIGVRANGLPPLHTTRS